MSPSCDVKLVTCTPAAPRLFIRLWANCPTQPGHPVCPGCPSSLQPYGSKLPRGQSLTVALPPPHFPTPLPHPDPHPRHLWFCWSGSPKKPPGEVHPWLTAYCSFSFTIDGAFPESVSRGKRRGCGCTSLHFPGQMLCQEGKSFSSP